MRAAAGLLTLALVAGCSFIEPLGPFAGGRLAGEVVSEPVADWSFTDDVRTIKLETRPDDPYSVTTWVLHRDGHLYVPCGEPEQRTWVANVKADPRVRLKIAGRIYERRALRVTGPDELRAAFDRLAEKYELDPLMAAGMATAWIFRMEPR